MRALRIALVLATVAADAPPDPSGVAPAPAPASQASDADVLDAVEDVLGERHVEVDAAAELTGGRATPPRPPRDPRILPLGGNTWSIASELRDFYAADVASLQELARPSPHRGPDGAMDGWEIHLERYELMHQAGFRNGDVVHRVNGRELDSWAAVLAAWKDLRKEERLWVELTRRDGRSVRLSYTIR